MLETDEEKITSLDKATKIALDLIIGTISRLQGEIDEINSVDTLSDPDGEELPASLVQQAS